MGFDPPTAREAGSGVNGCRFLGIPHGYTPGGASHARKHRTSAASALAISAVGAGETESNHVYCRILFEIMLFLTIILFMHSAFRGRGPRRATYEVPISDLVTPPALVAAHAVAGVGDIDRAAGIAIAARSCLLASGTGPGVEIDSSRGRDPRSPRRRPDPVGTPVRQSVRMDGISSTLPAVLKYTHTLMHASCLQMRCNGSR
jgi:hypothetical protein